MAKKAGKRGPDPSPQGGAPRLYELEVSLMGGPITESFAKANPEVTRTILIRSDQTLADLHDAIFEAFDREDEHMYEFQVGGQGPMDPEARRYVQPIGMEDPFGGPKPAGDVSKTTIEEVGLKPGEVFGYWFDFGDDWWHQIDVVDVRDEVPPGEYPAIANIIGESPPQYVDWDEEDEFEDEDEDEFDEEDEDLEDEEEDEEQEKG